MNRFREILFKFNVPRSLTVDLYRLHLIFEENVSLPFIHFCVEENVPTAIIMTALRSCLIAWISDMLQDWLLHCIRFRDFYSVSRHFCGPATHACAITEGQGLQLSAGDQPLRSVARDRRRFMNYRGQLTLTGQAWLCIEFPLDHLTPLIHVNI
jgi:hypothetical protein